MNISDLYHWSAKWGINPNAVADLRIMMGVDRVDTSTLGSNLVSETGVSKQNRLEMAREGGIFWRNNVGAMQDDTGRVVRYGLANESAAVNARIKSSDLIGIRPVRIGERVIGQFVARETKRPGWQYTGTPREEAQLRFLMLVTSLGGDAAFSNGSDL